jgi:Uma2 family endonuclease
MAQHTRAITADELWRMPDDGYHRYEIDRGQLLTMTPAGGLHGLIANRLSVAITSHVNEGRLGIVLSADTGFKLESDPDTVRAPDVAFIARERIPAEGIPESFWSGAPDLAVEVMSPGDRRSEVDEKIAQYLRLGVKQVWFVEPSPRRVTIHITNRPPQILQESDTLEGGELLHGFRYSLSKLFTIDLQDLLAPPPVGRRRT